ncbi:MAG: nitrile hydratase subunit beta [Pseudomonadota bacterium]|nr:nitrile hydratase subunit beta [Pseudomonadota bacterium]
MMNGVHDMGGIQNMGPIELEDNEPVFHCEWEGRVFALNMATGPLRLWNLDMKRQATESMQPPERYLGASYYERWLESLIKLFKERGVITEEELVTGEIKLKEITEMPSAASPDEVIALMGKGRSARVKTNIKPRFKVGDKIVTRNINIPTHTRLPRYVRGKCGRVERDHGVFIFPDTHSQNWEQSPQHVYVVSFTARELWGPDASSRDKVLVDLWDSYMDII